ncbi:hypothetical protein QFZ75_003667 [Streptomyces sp. V3I8]|uniref:hypothetical protein n=1 Tax=Streptomyces sp. V3I8 TaxID=3042279 RepID=UPI002787F904|nr:hypothetical protein [Streptomyces sp. V3I8]MDQ1037251.1 hypothetical protein [Streptomyces sp. V3I8]
MEQIDPETGSDPTTQQQYVGLAWDAASRAAQLAEHAERAARNPDKQAKAAALAAAGALWADVSRSYSAIVAVLPDGTPEA